MYVASGITSGVLLLSRKVMREQLGIDVRAQALARSTAFHSLPDDEVTAGAFAVRLEPDDGDLDAKYPALNDHDPSVIQKELDILLEDAVSAGMPVLEVERMRKELKSDLLDLFRKGLSAAPPAQVAPAEIRVDDAVFKAHQPTRHYKPEVSEFMHRFMTRLESMGFVRRVQGSEAVYASPAHPVRKENADPTAPIDEQYRMTVDLRVVNSFTDPVHYPIALAQDFP